MDYAIFIVTSTGRELVYIESNATAAHHAVEYLKATGHNVEIFTRAKKA